MKKGTREYRQAHIQEMQAWSLDKKITHSLKRIKEFYDAEDGKVYISFSGGKDSTALLHMVRSLYPDVVAVFSNTTNEYAEILDFVKKTENVTTLTPVMTFNETIKKYGFPLISKKASKSIRTLRNPTENNVGVRKLYLEGINSKGQKSPRWKLAKKWLSLLDVEFDVTDECCKVLKKDPFMKYERETGMKGIIGTQVSESKQREGSWIDYGCNIIDSKRPLGRPMSIWTENDIWEYIKRFNIPYSKIYDDVIDEETGEVLIDGEKRTGCAYCAFGAHLEKSDLITKNRFERLALRKPKQYKKMMKLENNGVTFSDALSFIKVNH